MKKHVTSILLFAIALVFIVSTSHAKKPRVIISIKNNTDKAITCEARLNNDKGSGGKVLHQIIRWRGERAMRTFAEISAHKKVRMRGEYEGPFKYVILSCEHGRHVFDFNGAGPYVVSQ
ncbi:MAG: hypothetical protein GY705_08445 [Bacteroidetes bacterium]|nr:hypothetical protein [Bacteroidota bacterium]